MKKTFAFVTSPDKEFVIRLYHDRTVPVFQGGEWVELSPEEVVQALPRPVRCEVLFKAQGCWRKCLVTLGYREVRPYFYGLNQRWVLLTNVPLRSSEAALADKGANR